MSRKTIFYTLLIISMAIWGISWSSAKVLSDYGSPLTLSFIRNFLMVFAMLPFLFFSKIGLKMKVKGLKRAFPAGVAFAAYAMVFFYALQRGLASAGGVLVTTINPLFAFLLGVVIDHFVPSRRQWFGLLVGLFAGSILLDLWSGTDHLLDKGNVFFIVAALIWALMSKLTSKSMRYGHPLVFNFWVYVTAAFVISFWVDYSEMILVLENGDLKFWLNMAYLSVINSGFATSCYLFATAEIGAEAASSFMFLVPLGAVFSSWLFLNETIPFVILLGGVLGVVSVTIINWEK